jgi:VWFA-related protein
MHHKLTASVVGFAVLGAILTATPSTSLTAAEVQERQARTFFASVVTKEGAPVTDLTAADFEVKEGGKTQEITSVKLATTPLRVHVVVSDGGTGAFQAGVLRLAQTLISRSEFAFTSVLVQPERVTPFTDNGELVGAGIQRLGRRGAGQGRSQLMEAMMDAVKDLAAPGKHSVLIVLRIGNEAASSIRANTIRDALRTAGATMYVVSRTGASRAPITGSSNAMTPEVAQRQMQEAEQAEMSLNLNLVLGDGARESGGYEQEISLTTSIETMQRLANEIKNQYEITYVLPAGTKPSDRLQVSTKRKNVTLRAPMKIAN